MRISVPALLLACVYISTMQVQCLLPSSAKMILGLKVIFPLLVPFFTMLGPAAALSRCTMLKISVSIISPAARSLSGLWGVAIVSVSFLCTKKVDIINEDRPGKRARLPGLPSFMITPYVLSYRLLLLVTRYDLLLYVRRNFFVLVEFHLERAASLSDRT